MNTIDTTTIGASPTSTNGHNQNGHNTYTTKRGMTVTFLSVAPLLDKLEAWRVAHMPKVPTYLPQTAAGIVAQPEPHYLRKTTETLKDPESGEERTVEKIETSLETPEEWEAWHAYEAALKSLQEEYATRFLRTILLRGVQAELPPDETWVREHEFMGFTVPTDPLERRWYWLETELGSSKEDYEQITLGVLRASGTSEEVVSAMEQTFRGSLGLTNRTQS